MSSLPAEPGLDASAMLAGVASGELKALVVAGVEPTDFASAQAVRDALENAGFVISLENRLSEVTERADVVFPVALIEEHAGTFLNWEHRPGRVNKVISHTNHPMTDLRVLAALADAMGTPLGIRTARSALAEIDELGTWDGARATAGSGTVAPTGREATAGYALATWRQLIDGGRGQDGEEALAATAKPTVARVSPATAASVGVVDGDSLTLSTDGGWYSLPVEVVDDMVEGTVWVPTNSPGTSLGELGVVAGDLVQLTQGGEA